MSAKAVAYSDCSRPTCLGSSSTRNRSRGHVASAQRWKSTPSSASTVRRRFPAISQGLAGSYSWTVNAYVGTNACSHRVGSSHVTWRERDGTTTFDELYTPAEEALAA